MPTPTDNAPLVYTVIATVPPAVLDDYVDWLLDGHVQAVVAGGAEQATVTRIDGDPVRIESRYIFRDQAAFARYEAEVAPALRADGIARFVEPHGATFTRWTGRLAGRVAAG